MNLLEKDTIINIYSKNDKMSRYFPRRVDLFIVLSVLVLLFSHIISNYVIAGFRSGADTDNKHKKTELLLSARYEELFGREWTEMLLREFEEKNTDLKLILMDNSDERDPDILIIEEGNFSSFAAALASLEPYFNQERNLHNFTANQRFDSPDEIHKSNMDLYTVPLVSFMDLLFYNIDLLSAAGFDRPPKTRDEFLAYTKAVSQRKSAGAVLSLSIHDRQAAARDVFSWIWASGGDFWLNDSSSQNAQKPVINTRSIIRDISFLGSLYGSETFASVSYSLTGEHRLEEFAQGKIALMIASTSVIPFLRERMGDNAFGITTIPDSGLAVKYNLCLSGFYAGINANCEYPDEAWSFLSFLAEQIPLLCARLNAVPGVVSGFFSGDFNYMQDDPFYSKARDIFESSEIVQGFSKTARAEEFERIVLEEMREFFESGRTAEQTAAAIQRRWDEIPAMKNR